MGRVKKSGSKQTNQKKRKPFKRGGERFALKIPPVTKAKRTRNKTEERETQTDGEKEVVIGFERLVNRTGERISGNAGKGNAGFTTRQG